MRINTRRISTELQKEQFMVECRCGERKIVDPKSDDRAREKNLG